MLGSKSVRRHAAVRYERLFARASGAFDQRMRAIVAAQAAKGLLISGATIRAAVRATSEVTHTAVSEALSGIARATEHAGNRREAMLAELINALGVHHVSIEASAAAALAKIGLGNDVHHAASLFAAERVRHTELIADFREGWTAPAGKQWNERHPILFVIVTALIGIGLGWAAKSLIGDQWQASNAQSANVAQPVAQEPLKATPSPQKPR